MGDGKRAALVALLNECLALVASEAICVPLIPISSELGELKGTTLLLMMGT